MQHAEQEVVDLTRLPEADLVFGGVDIHVHIAGRNFEKQHERRVPVLIQHIAVRLADRVTDDLVAHRAAVHIKILKIGLTAGVGGQRDPAVQAQTLVPDFEMARLLQERQAAHRRDPALLRGQVIGASKILYLTAVVPHAQPHVEAAQRQPMDDFLDAPVLGTLGAQEAAPCGGVEKQIPHFDRGTAGVGRRRNGGVIRRALDDPAGVAGLRVRGEREPGDGRDARQRLAAKAQGGHGVEIIQHGDLAGGVATQCQREVVAGDAGAVVADAHQLDAALFELDLDTVGAGVDAVFQQFLDHGGRTLHHFAGSDLIRQLGRQEADRGGVCGHGQGVPGSSGSGSWRSAAGHLCGRRGFTHAF